jgi:hypothetical protein
MPHRLRTLLQYRLGTLLLAMTLLGVLLGILVNRANRQKRTVAAIQAVRGVVQYDAAEPAGLRWLRKLIGDDYFQTVIVVDFATEFYGRRKALGLSKVDDAGLQCFESLPDVETIELGHNRAVTDQGLAHLRSLNKLRVLYLYDCSVTGVGATHLASLPNLTALELRWSPLTPEGILELGKLRRLTYLGLGNTPVTDDDLPTLKTLTNLKELRLSDTDITDRGLIHLEGLTWLQRLAVPIAISDDGLKRLQQALPTCEVHRMRHEP